MMHFNYKDEDGDADWECTSKQLNRNYKTECLTRQLEYDLGRGR